MPDCDNRFKIRVGQIIEVVWPQACLIWSGKSRVMTIRSLQATTKMLCIFINIID